MPNKHECHPPIYLAGQHDQTETLHYKTFAE